MVVLRTVCFQSLLIPIFRGKPSKSGKTYSPSADSRGMEMTISTWSLERFSIRKTSLVRNELECRGRGRLGEVDSEVDEGERGKGDNRSYKDTLLSPWESG